MMNKKRDGTPMMGRKVCLIAALLCLVLLSSLISGAPAAEKKKKIIVGGKNFTEGFIGSELLAQIIEAKTDITVERKLGLGGTYICYEALKNGEIDLYPEYTGTALLALMKHPTMADPEEVFSTVKEHFRNKGLIFLSPLGFNNTYTLTMTRKKASALGIRCISDLKSKAGTLDFSCTHEFIERPDGYRALSKFYGFEFKSVRGMDPGLTYLAAKQGHADIIDGFSTDGRIPAFDLIILEDDWHFFPPYYAAPFIREGALKRYPELEDALRSLAGQISNPEIQKMNYQVDQLGLNPREVAANFLSAKGFIPASSNVPETGTAFWSIVLRRKADIALFTLQHIELTFVAVLLAIIFAVPLGIVMSRWGKLADPIMAVINVIQTLPSLALLGFMVPIFGIGVVPAIIALFLYALLPIVSNTYTGIKQVDPALIEAARGMGMKDMQILLRVELPLSLTVIMAGVRTSTVINVGTATLAAFIGGGGLGALILRGISMSNNNLILAGAIPASLLAVFADRLLKGVEISLGRKKKRRNPA
jgi:osmoprotectant transport system permease protein